MYRLIYRNTITLCGAVVIPQASENVNSDNFDVKWQRVKNIFKVSEFGEITPQLQTAIQSTLFTGFFGCIYGGFINAREEYFKFIERNEATKFTDHFEAKKKLQHNVSLGFVRGGLRWGWRLALFGGFYISFVTIFTAYRGSSSLIDFTGAGLLSGIIYRIHMGGKAMIASGTLGAMMGLTAGGLTSLLLHLTGSTLDDVQTYTNELTAIRSRHYEELMKKTKKQDPNNLIDMHQNVISNEKSS